MDVEHAIFVECRADDRTPAKLFDLLRSVHRPDRLYYGSEACEHALPGAADLRLVKDECSLGGIGFTLVTPVCSNRGLDRLAPLLAQLDPDDEAVFNDWGGFEAVGASGRRPVLGRALHRCARDPRIDPAKLSPRTLEFVRASNLQDPGYQGWLRRHGIVRVEIDNVRQGLGPPPPGSIPTSVHVPFVFISASRYCGGAFADRCRGTCPQSTVEVDGAATLVRGLAAYYRNDATGDWTRTWPVDRIVTAWNAS